MTLKITNRIKEIEQVHFQLNDYVKALPLSDNDRKKIYITVDEILSNIISYGYEDNQPHTIEVRFETSERDLIMEFIDDGKYFDPVYFIHHNVPKIHPDGDQNGGLGLHLVYRLMHQMHYDRQDNLNKLRISLKLADNVLEKK